MDRISEFIQNVTGLGPQDQAKLLQSIVIILLLGAVRWSVHRVLRRKIDDVSQRYYWTRVTTYTIAAIGIILVARVWIQGIGPLIGYLGIVSAGLAIALHDTVSNLAGWGFILSRRPFQRLSNLESMFHARSMIFSVKLQRTMCFRWGRVIMHIPANR